MFLYWCLLPYKANLVINGHFFRCFPEIRVAQNSSRIVALKLKFKISSETYLLLPTPCYFVLTIVRPKVESGRPSWNSRSINRNNFLGFYVHVALSNTGIASQPFPSARLPVVKFCMLFFRFVSFSGCQLCEQIPKLPKATLEPTLPQRRPSW